MAKCIKFNLKFNDKQIRTIEDLQENFSIEDVLDYYHNGLLERWLKVRGYSEKYDISKIKSDNDIDIIMELIKIFDVSKDENEIKESVYILKYLKEKQEKLEQYEKDNFKKDKIIEDYKKEYDYYVSILQNSRNIYEIRSTIEIIVNNYFWLFELNHRAIFWKLVDISPLAIIYI